MVKKITAKPPTSSPSNIITDHKNLQAVVDIYRKQKKKIVLTQGTFDLVHIGHARYCDEAKKYGDVLIVGIDSDEKVKSRKGPDRPVVPEGERLEMMTYLRSVDVVVLKPLKAPKWQLIKLVRPDVLVATHNTYQPEDLKNLEKYCTHIVVLEPMATTSTSAKIRLLQIGAAKQISEKISSKLIAAMEDVLKELKGE